MKILKTYTSEEQKKTLMYSDNSPLIREIKSRFDLTEVILPVDYTEEEYAELIRQYDVLLTMWGSAHVPNELAQNPGNLKYICNITGEISKWIDEEIVASPYITFTNWGDAAGYGIAEGAVSLLMTMIKDIPLFISHARNKKDRPDNNTRRVGTLYKNKVGIFGMGFIGRKFVEYIKPFMPDIYAFDPYVDEMPEGVTKVDTLEELFRDAHAIVIHAGLTPETKGVITKDLLAMLPDGAVFINTARGAIVDENALIAEIMSGRIRAGLDVMDQNINPANADMPAVDDPVRMVSNAVFTGHHIGGDEWSADPEKLCFIARNCIENLERFEKGEPLKFVIDVDRYRKMT